MSTNGQSTHCNARLKGRSEELPEADPGPWEGDGYCKRTVSSGRCKDHGGNGGRPPSHGLRSSLRDELREFVTEAANMQNPGDLTGELSVLRGLLFRFLDDKEDPEKEDIEAAHKLLKEIRRTSDTIHKQMTRERLTKDEEEKLFNTFAKILRKYVPDEDDRESAIDELDAALSGGGRPALESSSG